MDELGVIILGPPGSGKSDLALRLIDQPGNGTSGRLRMAQLVSDDQVLISRSGGGLLASAPGEIRGKLEVRGLGIVTLPVRATVRLALAVRLAVTSSIERMPEPEAFDLLGIPLPMVRIDPAQSSAPARLRAALDGLEDC
jgi:serine kinase of HPr protein (carbohydrate metabolism regulator)